jgi:hypothetical protein
MLDWMYLVCRATKAGATSENPYSTHFGEYYSTAKRERGVYSSRRGMPLSASNRQITLDRATVITRYGRTQ